MFLTSFLRNCKDIENFLLWVLWECLIMPINMIVSPFWQYHLGHAWFCTRKWHYHIVENCWVYLQAKYEFHPPCLSGDITNYTNLFWELWACLVTHTQNIRIKMPEYVWICLYEQDSEYTSGPKYAKILNVAGFSICERYTAFWICQNMLWQSSKYTLGYEYARILNMAGFWYMQELHRVLNMPQYGWVCFNRM